MAQVDVTINNRAYRIACDDGQEEHLTRLGDYVDGRVQELVSAVGQVGDQARQSQGRGFVTPCGGMTELRPQ